MLEQVTLDKENTESICGISIAPKKGYALVRIWISDAKMNDPNKYKFCLPSYSPIMFKDFGVQEG